MNLSNLFNVLLTASPTDAASAGTGVVSNSGGGAASCNEMFAAGGGWGLIIMYAVVIGAFYLIFIRPQNKRREQEDKMRKSVEMGDEITTIGGIVGKVVSIKEDETLVIETGTDRNKMRIKTWAISSNETARQRSEYATPEQGEKKGFFGLFKKN